MHTMLFAMYKYQIEEPDVCCKLDEFKCDMGKEWYMAKYNNATYMFSKDSMTDMFDACNLKNKHGIGHMLINKFNTAAHIVDYYKITDIDKTTFFNEYGGGYLYIFNKYTYCANHIYIKKHHSEVIECLRKNHLQTNKTVDKKFQDMFRLLKKYILEPFFNIPDKWSYFFKCTKYNVEYVSIRMFYDENPSGIIIVIIDLIDECIVLHINAIFVKKYSEWMSMHALHLRDLKSTGNECLNLLMSCNKLVNKMDCTMHKHLML